MAIKSALKAYTEIQKNMNKLSGLNPVASVSMAANTATKAAPSKYGTETYDDAIKTYTNKVKSDAEDAKKTANSEYDNQAKQAYISKMQNQRQLSKNLAEQGIRGGASETAQLKQQSNYENTRNTIASNRQTALRNIDKEANDNIFNFTMEQNAAKQAYIQQREQEDRQVAEQKRQEAVQAKEAQKERDWQAKQTAKTNKVQEYVATVGRYNTVDKCDAAIKKIKSLKKKNPAKYKKELWKIKYIQAQRAEIQNKKK